MNLEALQVLAREIRRADADDPERGVNPAIVLSLIDRLEAVYRVLALVEQYEHSADLSATAKIGARIYADSLRKALEEGVCE